MDLNLEIKYKEIEQNEEQLKIISLSTEKFLSDLKHTSDTNIFLWPKFQIYTWNIQRQFQDWWTSTTRKAVVKGYTITAGNSKTGQTWTNKHTPLFSYLETFQIGKSFHVTMEEGRNVHRATKALRPDVSLRY